MTLKRAEFERNPIPAERISLEMGFASGHMAALGHGLRALGVCDGPKSVRELRDSRYERDPVFAVYETVMRRTFPGMRRAMPEFRAEVQRHIG